MSLFIRNYKPNSLATVYNVKIWRLHSTAAESTQKKDENEEEFRVLDILKKKDRIQRKVTRRADIQPDRSDRMAPDQNWGNVWPGPKTFHPSSVPLPLRQGYVPKGQAPPGKKANAELMKVPNFLHLTPPVIKSQCEAIKQYCTEWPNLLNSQEAIEKHYPVEIITSDYCHASPSIRNPLARIVTLRVKLSTLKLDKHARDKFIRLVGDRYDSSTDLVTITADRCPARIQNTDYVNYLLTACFHEAWNVEEWEKDKTEDDMEYYDWNNNASKKSLVNWHLQKKGESKTLTDDEYKSFDVSEIQHADGYKNAVSDWMNSGESEETVKKYAEAVRKLFGLPEKKVV
ncbi:28S ribosomal protein S35, mitochondrial [Trichoplusia ni]|uniref:28S ribosomal protein S35, mitochondrial n=1 Tax=Trichoplusia ni TaxID=7111 RepID=A0A7E5X5V2_TRINI|nr:28S ribosomal protein S35, mitochondrial [Trichoplusia ni]